MMGDGTVCGGVWVWCWEERSGPGMGFVTVEAFGETLLSGR